MSSFTDRFDSNRRVGMRVYRKCWKERPAYFICLCLVLPIAPLFWALFAWNDPEKPIACKNKYP